MDSHLDEIHEIYYKYQESIKEGDLKKSKELWIEVERIRTEIANVNR